MAKILIVDDDNDFSQACTIMLEGEGYEVVSASSPAEAEPLLNDSDLDLILLDVMMENPDDGITLAHKIKKEGITTPVIMLSGVSKVTGYEYKCDEMIPCADFIEKPVVPNVLLDKIKAVLGN